MFEKQKNRLLNTLDEAHEAYRHARRFTGPSVYFHVRALEAARSRDFERFTESAYAMLASWGMHRMGRGSAKMRGFEDFQSSLCDVWPAALSLQAKTPADLCDSDWAELKAIFCGIRCMATRVSLVGNSKIMAHLLSNLIAPVDGQYTLKLLFGHNRIKKGIEAEWMLLAQILERFFYPIVCSPLFQSKAATWLADPNRSDWDTSELKIVDNLIVGLDFVGSDADIES